MNAPVKDSVILQLELTDEQALALAQLCKRLSWAEYRQNAASESEAYTMRTAVTLLRDELAYKGFAPR
jgi:predicted ATPase